jgi:hypothetical protein
MTIKHILLALLGIGLAMALAVRPDYLGVQDTGNGNLPTMDVALTIDCGTNALGVEVKSNETGETVADASTYLFYTNYGYQAISSGKTGQDGISAMAVTGKMNLLTALFIIRVDKPGFQSREIEFAYKKCFDAQPPSGNNPPPANATQQQNNSVNTTNNTTKNITDNTTTTDGTANHTTNNAANNTTDNTQPKPTSSPPSSSPCAPAFLLCLILIPLILRK